MGGLKYQCEMAKMFKTNQSPDAAEPNESESDAVVNLTHVSRTVGAWPKAFVQSSFRAQK